MSPTTSSRPRTRQAAARPGGPALRLVHEESWEKNSRGEENGLSDAHPERDAPLIAEQDAPLIAERDAQLILIVAASARERALVHGELTATLPPDTRFAQASNVWEVLQKAPRSGVVMLAGDLPDVCAHTLVELLGRRQPWLPVVVLDAPEEQTRSGGAPAEAVI